MENFDGENTDKLLKIHQYFYHQNFVPYSIYDIHFLSCTVSINMKGMYSTTYKCAVVCPVE